MNENDMDKVQIYFEAALAVPAEKRTAFLAELCGQRTELFNEVQALLLADEQTKIWDSSRIFNPTIQQSKTLQPGEEIGPYSIIELIGEGGMGLIYKALDKRLERHVALKFLPAGMHSDAQTRQRFLAEARAASQLDHPNICVIHDVGETPKGQLFIAMPCYQGETLSKRIGRGPLTHLEAIDIILQVADGLACAHAHGIVHRDIKPANIMLTGDGGVKVLDFGIAKVENINLTQTGMSIGTLAYMSPEQLRGEPVDARTDIWALGVVLYEALSGQQAFPAKALPDILQSVLEEADKTVAVLVSNLPPELSNVLQQSMERDLQQRFPDMSSMVNALYEARQALGDDKTRILTSLNSHSPNKHNAKARAYAWDEKVLDQIANILLPLLGPIAPMLVKRKSKHAADLNELCTQLTESLPDSSSREKFNQQLKNQVAAFTSPPVPHAIKTDGSLAGVALSPKQQADIEGALIAELGPITQTLIKRHAMNATSPQQLFDALAQHIDNQNKKQLFLQKMSSLFESD